VEAFRLIDSCTRRFYSKADPANRHYHDAAVRALALRIGDLLASENEKVTMASMIKSTSENTTTYSSRLSRGDIQLE